MFKKHDLVILITVIPILLCIAVTYAQEEGILEISKNNLSIIILCLLITCIIPIVIAFRMKNKYSKEIDQRIEDLIAEKAIKISECMVKSTLFLREDLINNAVIKIQTYGAKYSPDATRKVLEALIYVKEDELKELTRTKLIHFRNESKEIKKNVLSVS